MSDNAEWLISVKKMRRPSDHLEESFPGQPAEDTSQNMTVHKREYIGTVIVKEFLDVYFDMCSCQLQCKQNMKQKRVSSS